MDAFALGRREIIDAPPAHLEKAEADDDQEDGHLATEGIAR